MTRATVNPHHEIFDKLKPFAHPYGKNWYKCTSDVLKVVKDL